MRSKKALKNITTADSTGQTTGGSYKVKVLKNN